MLYSFLNYMQCAIIQYINLEVLKMLDFKLKDINNPFKTRQGETIVDLDKYIEVLKENKISFTQEQYEEAKKNLDK